MAADGYYKSGNAIVGPLSVAEMRQHVADETIGPETLVRKGQSGKWIPARKVKGFAEAFPSAHEASPPEELRRSSQPPTPRDWTSQQIGVGAAFVVGLVLVYAIANRPQQEHGQRRGTSQDAWEPERRALDSIDRELDSIETEAIRRISTGRTDLGDLHDRVDSAERIARRQKAQTDRRPSQPGYTLQERKEAAIRVLMSQGYSREEAQLTVEDMVRHDLLPDPPRR